MFPRTFLFILIYTLFIDITYSKTFISQIGPNLSYPWGVAKIDEKSVLVTEKSGALKKINVVNGNLKNISGVPEVFYMNQGGLLDVYVNHRDNKIYVFLCYSSPTNKPFYSKTILEKSVLKGNSLVEREIIFSTKKALSESIHFGCRITISGNYVYLSLGDRGNRNNAQDINNYEGSIVRVNLKEQVLNQNEFNKNWMPETYSIGHRNPQGLVTNLVDGSIWSNEHGPQGGDEINLINGGNNYGWPEATHGEEYGGGKIGQHSVEGLIDPKWVWIPSIAPSGMAYYKGDMFPELNDHFLIGSLKFKQIHAVKVLNDYPILERKLLNKPFGRIRDLEVMNDGSILFLTDEKKEGLYKGGLYKIFRSE